MFGLDNLVYLGTHQPELFRQLRHKTHGQRADWEYPFAVAGLNLTFTLADVLGVAGSSPGKLPTTAAGERNMELEHAWVTQLAMACDLCQASYLIYHVMA